MPRRGVAAAGARAGRFRRSGVVRRRLGCGACPAPRIHNTAFISVGQAMLQNVQLSCFLLSYLCAFVCEVVGVLRRSGWWRVAAISCSGAGLLAQTAFLLTRSRQAGLPPLLSSTQDWLLVLAWLVVVLYLAILAVDRKLPLGLFLLPVSLGLILVSLSADEDPQSLIADAALRRWGMLHAGSLAIGTGAVLLGFVLSLMYLIQHRRLRRKALASPRVPLPNLEKLAALNWWCVVVAVPLLTIGLLAGVILGRLSARTATGFSLTDPVVLVNVVVWFVMAALFYRVVRRRETSGRSVAWQTIGAVAFLLATIVALELLTGDGRLDSFHSARPAAAAGETAADGPGGGGA